MIPSSRLQRIRFRSQHLGMRELDLLLGKYAEEHLQNLNAEQLDVYEGFLEKENPDIYNWITGGEPVPEKYVFIVKELASHNL